MSGEVPNMTIKAILRDGVIQPVDPIPPEWVNGQELVVEEPAQTKSAAEIAAWERELEESVAQIPAEEHQRFLRALEEGERESKESVRREWGLP